MTKVAKLTDQGPFDLVDGVRMFPFWGDGMMMNLVDLDPNSVVPVHSHPHEQMGLMLSGRLRFTVGGITRTLGPGDLWRIPGGVPHSVAALDEPAIALDVFHPIRQDYL